jgi:hypothetical protein
MVSQMVLEELFYAAERDSVYEAEELLGDGNFLRDAEDEVFRRLHVLECSHGGTRL